MELFTLGADRGAYTETDVREISRALSGWDADWVDPTGWQNFRFVPARWDPGSKTVFGKTRRVRLGGRLPAGARAPAARLVLRRQALELLHPGAAVRRPSRPSSSSSTSARGHQIRPVVEAILCSPEFYEGPRMVKPPVVLAAGPAARARQADHRRALGLAVRRRRPAPLLPAGRRRLGRQALARHEHDPRALGHRQLRPRGQDVLPGRRATPRRRPTQALAKARAAWGDPSLTADDRRVAHASSPPVLRDEPARAGIRAQRQNALRQLIAASPDYQTC